MDRLLACPCGHKLVVAPSQAGQTVVCDECGRELAVPNLRGLRQLPPTEEAASASAAPAAKRAAWGGWHGPALSVATALFLISGIACGWFLLQRNAIPPEFLITAEDEINAGNELFETFTPETLTSIWDDYQTNGLGPRTRPPFYLWRLYAEERLFLAKINGSIALLSGAAAVAIWISARRR